MIRIVCDAFTVKFALLLKEIKEKKKNRKKIHVFILRS